MQVDSLTSNNSGQHLPSTNSREEPIINKPVLERRQVLEQLEVSMSHRYKLLELYRQLHCEFKNIAIDPESPVLRFLNRHQVVELFSLITAMLGSCFSTFAFAELISSKFDDAPEDYILGISWVFATLVILFLAKTIGSAVGADEVIKRIEEEKALFKDEVLYNDEELRFEALTPLYAERTRYETRRFWGIIFAVIATAVEVGAFYYILSQGMVAPDPSKYIATLIASFVSFPIGFLKGHDRGVKFDSKITFHHIAKMYEEKAEILQKSLDHISGSIDDHFLSIVDRKALEREQALRDELKQQEHSYQDELQQKDQQIDKLEIHERELLNEQELANNRHRLMEADLEVLKAQIGELKEQEKLSQAYRERNQELEKQLSRLLPLTNTIGQEGRKLDDLMKSQLTYTVWNADNGQLKDELDAKVESPIEQMLLDGIRKENILLPEAQVQIRDAEGKIFTRPDFAYPDSKLAIYCDGARYHAPQNNAENWQRDLEIGNKLQLMGWKVLRFSGSQIHQKLPECLQKIRDALQMSNSP